MKKLLLLLGIMSILGFVIAACGTTDQKDALVTETETERAQYENTVTREERHGKIQFDIPAPWEEASMGKVTTPIGGDTFYLYDGYISENEDGAIAELLVSDRIPADSYGIDSSASFASSREEFRKGIFEKDWGEYFDYGTLIFEGTDNEITLPNGKVGYQTSFTVDGDPDGKGEYLAFYNDGSVYFLVLFYNDLAEYDYSDVFDEIIASLEVASEEDTVESDTEETEYYLEKEFSNENTGQKVGVQAWYNNDLKKCMTMSYSMNSSNLTQEECEYLLAFELSFFSMICEEKNIYEGAFHEECDVDEDGERGLWYNIRLVDGDPQFILGRDNTNQVEWYPDKAMIENIEFSELQANPELHEEFDWLVETYNQIEEFI